LKWTYLSRIKLGQRREDVLVCANVNAINDPSYVVSSVSFIRRTLW